MRCQSLQSLWGPAPPRHHIRSLLVLPRPSSLWTGAQDGTIMLWRLSLLPPSPTTSDQEEVWPVALLCGHTAAIVALEICNPNDTRDLLECTASDTSTRTGGSVNRDCSPEHYGAVMSACLDGGLCMWDALTGFCQLRRNLPPWVGTPCAISALPGSPRYACVACNQASTGGRSADAGQKDPDSNAVGTGEKGASGTSVYKGAVIIVDTATLSLLQVVYNGALGLGPMVALVAVPDVGHEGQSSFTITVVDQLGKVRVWSAVCLERKKPESETSHHALREHVSGRHTTSIDASHAFPEAVLSVSVSPDGAYLLMILPCKWVLTSVTEGKVLAEAACTSALHPHRDAEASDVQHGLEQLADFSVWAGGSFFPEVSSCKVSSFSGKFLVWEKRGAAVLYSLVKSGEQFVAVDVLVRLIPSTCDSDNIAEFRFFQLGDFVLRLKFAQYCLGESPAFEHQVTVWFIQQAASMSYKSTSDLSHDLHEQSEVDSSSGIEKPKNSHRMVAVLVQQAQLWGDWFETPSIDTPLIAEEQPNRSETTISSHERSVLEPSTFVTASMLLSGSTSAPSMLVYGFASGGIRLVELEGVYTKDPEGFKDKERSGVSTTKMVRSLFGHTGAILCLAEHNLPTSSDQEKGNSVLVSGSMDCTICIWNVRAGGEPLAVLHHHVAPVRQLSLPAPGTPVPFSHCFISVSDDSCVALISLETLGVERILPGHLGTIKALVWDSLRGFLACLCSHKNESSVGYDEVYIWDLHSGARERKLRGTPAHSIFTNILSRTRKSADANSIFSGSSTSASSLLAPPEEPAARSRPSPVVAAPQAPPLADSSSQSLKNWSGLLRATDPPTSRGGSHGEVSQGMLGSLEKLSVRVSQTLNQSVKPSPLKAAESLLTSSTTVKSGSSSRALLQKLQPICGATPVPGVVALQFDLFALMAADFGGSADSGAKEPQLSSRVQPEEIENSRVSTLDESKDGGSSVVNSEESLSIGKKNLSQSRSWLGTVQARLLRMSLAFLHLWGVDKELDKVLLEELQVFKAQHVSVGVGLSGDRGAMTLLLPSYRATSELWKTSPEFCALRSLTMMALAQRLLVLAKPASVACSALAAFYSRSLLEKLPGTANPSLEVYACFWQDPIEHIRMAARSLFHCAAARAIPQFLRLDIPAHRSPRQYEKSYSNLEADSRPIPFLKQLSSNDLADAAVLAHISEWLQSCGGENWIAIIGGSNQDARAARIVVGAALSLWYPSLVRPELVHAVGPMLLNLVRAAHDRHSATAADILADGMESTWQTCIGNEVPQLIVDVFFLVGCLSGGVPLHQGSVHLSRPALSSGMASGVAMTIRDSLTGNLLLSLAKANVPAFLSAVHNQLATLAPDSPVHLVALMALIRLVRMHPRALISHLGQALALVMQTMDSGNSALRKTCVQTAMGVVREMARVLPMVALHQGSSPSNSKVAVGDGVGDVRSLVITVYDLHSATVLKVLDASGPPGHPALLASNKASATGGGISALSFSPDGEGLVAFSQQGLTIRWWSLGAAWWERLSRNHVAVQCTKLVLVAPWAGFSPRSSSSSIMALAYSSLDQVEEELTRREEMSPRLAFHNLDLSFRLEWQPNKKVALLHHGQELGMFQL